MVQIQQDTKPRAGIAPDDVHRGNEWASSFTDTFDFMLPSRPIKWRLLRAQICYYGWQIVTKVTLGVVYFAVIAEGLRIVMPALGMKLHKIPGLSGLYDFEATHKLDLAHCLSIFLLIGVWTMWTKILELWLGCDEAFRADSWNVANHKRLVVMLGVLILSADLYLFYIAMTELGWTGSSFSMTALVATAAYLGVIILMTYIGVNLHQNVLDRKKEMQSCE